MRHKRVSGRVLLRFAVALAMLSLSLVGAPAHASDADEIPFNSAKILEFHNAERSARGIGGLSRDPRLDSHAQQLAESLAARGVLEHSPSVARSLGYAAGGQNLVMRAPTINASEANYMWMTSANHRKNLLNPHFTHVGIGMACSRASGRAFPVAVVDFGGVGLTQDVPPQDPIAVPAGALQGHSLVCDGSSAQATAAPGLPPAPAPAPAPAPVAAPVAAKPAPKPAAPKVVAAPPAPAPVPAPSPVVEPAPAPLEIASAPVEKSRPAADEKQLAQTSIASTDRSMAGWSAFVAGCMGAMMLAGVAGGLWYRRRPASAGALTSNPD
ncbi:MAG TPA: CAP domain-containing protein [Actinomycetota bacterium]|nr:CAP domain-containing protein [Actinomycetota bacterium]